MAFQELILKLALPFLSGIQILLPRSSPQVMIRVAPIYRSSSIDKTC